MPARACSIASARLAKVATAQGASLLPACTTIRRMAQGKRISANIDGEALQAIKGMGAAAKLARMSAGEGQAVAAARLGVHIQTIARIESGVAIGHVLGMLALYGITVKLHQADAGQLES